MNSPSINFQPRRNLWLNILLFSVIFVIFNLFGFFVKTQHVFAAQNIDASSIQVTTELSDNLVRIYNGGTAQFSVSVTVTQAKTVSSTNLDKIYLGSDILDFGVSGNFDRTITAFGAGIGKGNNDNCSAKTVSAFIGSNKVFSQCAFIANGSQAVSSGQVEVAKKYTYNFTLDSAAINSLALTSPCPRNSQTTPCFTVWPYFYLSKIGVDSKLAVTGASKDVYVQSFPDKASLDAAVASGQRPSDIPGNGSNTGGADIGGGGNRLAALFNQIFGLVIGFLQELVYGIFYWLIAPLIQAMLSIHVYTDTFVAVIYPGWEVIRNICNIFFIIALIVIALATLFRVESYQARGLLVQLILAALMINFSLVIAQAILALADTVQAQFLPANVTVIRSLAGDLMVGTYRDLYITKAFSDASFSGIIKPLFFLAMSIGSFAVFTAIAVFLLIRVVAIWLLLLISPLAYALGVLPSTAQYKKTWWDNFLKYAFFTPIMAFFLNMTAVISNQFKDNTILQTVSDPRLVQDLGNQDLSAFVFRVASNLLLLVFLVAALKVADMAGIYGASAITSTAQKGIFAPFAITAAGLKAGSSFAAQKIHKNYGIELRPAEWKHAYENYRKKRVEEDKQIGGAVAEERREHGSEVLAKLGAPEDFFRVFLNPAEWKRIAKGGQTKALREYHKANELEKEIDSKMSKTERKNKEEEIENLKIRMDKNATDLAASQLDLDRDDFTGKKNADAMAKFFFKMEERAKELTSGGDIEGAKALQKSLKKLKERVAKGDKSIDLSSPEFSSSVLPAELKNFMDDEKTFDQADIASLQNELAKKEAVDDEKYAEIKTRMLEAKRLGDELRSPESYEHRLERLHLESEESGKLRGIDNAEQLYALLVEAIRSKNRFRAAAIMKKMSEDYNDNEFLNLTIRPGTGGLSYSSGADGMKHYMEDVLVGQLGMDHQSALQLTDELSYINEKKNHWENARTVKYKNGELHYNSELEHTIAAMVEITKRGPRDVAREFNRLAIGTEVQHPDGHREFKLSKLGIAFAKIVGTQLHQANQMGFMTGSMLRRFSENEDVLRKNGVPESVIIDIVNKAKSTNLDPVEVVKKVI